jgi:hypothetical protein
MLVAGTGAAQAAKKVVVGPGDSIQAAVDAAQPGDTILVKGRHQENVAITTDGITLRGLGAVLAPAATPTQNACSDPSAPADVNGICILGDVNFVTGEVIREVRDVTVSGFTIRGFSEGIVAVGAHDATFERNVAAGNAGYGITAFSSTGTRMLFNRASGSGEAGFYIGDSPAADAALIGNESSANLFGVLIRNALHGKAVANSIHGNCAGVAVLADGKALVEAILPEHLANEKRLLAGMGAKRNSTSHACSGRWRSRPATVEHDEHTSPASSPARPLACMRCSGPGPRPVLAAARAGEPMSAHACSTPSGFDAWPSTRRQYPAPRTVSITGPPSLRRR